MLAVNNVSLTLETSVVHHVTGPELTGGSVMDYIRYLQRRIGRYS